jgi:hypothetical protein
MMAERSNAGPRPRKGSPMLRRLAVVVVTVLILTAAPVMAQDAATGDRTGQWAAAANDPITVAAGETLSVVIGARNQVRIDGEVDNLLLIIDGDAVINGTVSGQVVIISGTVTLGPEALIADILLFRSEITQQPGSIVTGNIETRSNVFFLEWWNSPFFALAIWLILTLFLIAGGMIFALAAGQQLPDFASATNHHMLPNIVTALILWIGLPILGVLVMLTIIGIPLGLVIFGLVLPGVWWLGFTVIGTRIGLVLLGMVNRRHARRHAVLAAFLGMVALQLTSLIPYVGGTIIFWSAVYGSGALLYHVTRARRDHPIDPELAAYAGPELASR